MSEFSDSYHLRTDDQQQGVELLKRAGMGGYVYPATNGWVTIFPDCEPFTPNPILLNANEGVLLHYMYAGDFGWGFELYDRSNQICRFHHDWGHAPDLSELDWTAFQNATGIEIAPDAFAQLYDESIDLVELVFSEPGAKFAKMVGAENAEWMSFQYLYDDYDPDKPEFAGVIEIM